MIDRRLIQNFDWVLLLLTAAIIAVGLVTLYSALSYGGKVHAGILTRQIYWFGLGVLVMILAFSLDYQWFERFAYPAYGIGIVLLVSCCRRVPTPARQWSGPTFGNSARAGDKPANIGRPGGSHNDRHLQASNRRVRNARIREAQM